MPQSVYNGQERRASLCPLAPLAQVLRTPPATVSGGVAPRHTGKVWSTRDTQEPSQRVMGATRGGVLPHQRRSVRKTHDAMVWSPHYACTKVWGYPTKESCAD